MQAMLIVKANGGSEVDLDDARLADLLEFHDAMVSAGVVRSVEALRPWSQGVRVLYSAGRRTIVDELVPEAQQQQIVGFWLIHVNSMHEAIEWAKRVPLVGGEVEVRQTAFQLLPVCGASH